MGHSLRHVLYHCYLCIALSLLLIDSLFGFFCTFAVFISACATVEDTAILDASLDIVTSRKVRDKMKLGHTVGE